MDIPRRVAYRTFVAVEPPAFNREQAVERCFSRLKGLRSLNNITLQGRAKVTAHCYLSLIAMQAVARPLESGLLEQRQEEMAR